MIKYIRSLLSGETLINELGILGDAEIGVGLGVLGADGGVGLPPGGSSGCGAESTSHSLHCEIVLE